VSGLAHYLEDEGLATVIVALVREHIVSMRPPRALWVPFELGRPFGPPGNSSLQRRVLNEALALFDQDCADPLLRDFSETVFDAEEDADWRYPGTLDNASLRAEVAAAESTINLQDLRITALEKQADEGVASLAALKSEAGDTETIAIEMPEALSTLRMAQSAEEDPNLGRFHALLIANEAYVNMPRLSTPVRDVRDIEKLLVDRYGFKVQVLTDATDDMIMRALHDYSNTLTDEDNLMVYYAGRGSTPDGPPDRAYWLGVDADPELRNTWLLSEHISDKIKQIDAQRILVVTDSCFSRRRVQPKSAALGRGVDPNIFRQMASLKSRVVLTSGANVPVSDENGDRTHSLFAKYFMEILRQNENVLSGEMLSYELGSRVREKVENPDRVTPTYTSLQDAGHRGGDFFFVPVQQPLMVAQMSTGKDSV